MKIRAKKYAALLLALSGILLKWIPERFCVGFLIIATRLLAEGRTPREGLKMLLELNNKIYALTGKWACDYGDGLHPKHRLMKYHDFFINRISPAERVIDIGCGNGALTYDMAERAGAMVTGIELNASSLIDAKKRYGHRRIRYVSGDVLQDLPDETFDVAVMSNVLEHISNRVAFLRNAQEILRPERWLLRVPLYERDWRVPVMQELEIDHRLDPTHCTEYTQESFAEEMKQAGLEIVHHETRWGEIWAETRPTASTPAGSKAN